MKKEQCTAIVLAAGQGKRMGMEVQKQYLELAGKPVLAYSLEKFQESTVIDSIILVVGEDQEEYVRKEIIEPYKISKVSGIVTGGKERYHSVWNGLQLAESGYVFIHDGARPFLDDEIIERVYREVQVHKACVVSMPVKDTIKMADSRGFVTSTPDRNYVWLMQTPQVFETELVKKAYEMLMQAEMSNVTDDAMVVEQMLHHPIKLVQGSYENIKITTPEDLDIANALVKRKNKNLHICVDRV